MSRKLGDFWTVRRVVVLTSPLVALALSSSASADFGPKKSTLGAGVKDANAPTANVDKGPSALDVAKTNKGSVTLGDDTGKKTWALVPPTHTVRKGDTLWDICDHYFNNPWQWPRVWSYNPDILNPHWIFPGEVVKLKKEQGSFSLGLGPEQPTGVVLKPKLVKPGTVFLRDMGFVYDDKTEDTGEVIGSPEDRMLLSTYNKVYVRVTAEQAKSLFPGDSLTVFHQSRAIKVDGKDLGKVVQILGTIRVDKVDKDSKLVEGTIVEALDVIERGARVGPIERRIDIVPPVTNPIDLRGIVLASVLPQIIYGANQVLLIDKGEKEGVKVGNRIFVVHRGDQWRKGLSASGELAASSVTLNTDSSATVEKKAYNTPEDSPDYPEEVVAEVRVLRVREHTATCLVTSSQREMEPGDTWVMKKGY